MTKAHRDQWAVQQMILLAAMVRSCYKESRILSHAGVDARAGWDGEYGTRCGNEAAVLGGVVRGHRGRGNGCAVRSRGEEEKRQGGIWLLCARPPYHSVDTSKLVWVHRGHKARLQTDPSPATSGLLPVMEWNLGIVRHR